MQSTSDDSVSNEFALQGSLTIFEVDSVFQAMPTPLPMRITFDEEADIDSCGFQLLILVAKKCIEDDTRLRVVVRSHKLYEKLTLIPAPYDVVLDEEVLA